MENFWTQKERLQNLDPIMEEKEKSRKKDSQSESSESASTVKHWDQRWTSSEAYDSSGTTSDSEQGDEYDDDYRFSGLHDQSHAFCQSQGCLCQSCLLGYARVIALQGSLPNVCTAASLTNLHHRCGTPYSSIPSDLSQRGLIEMSSRGFNGLMAHPCCQQHLQTQQVPRDCGLHSNHRSQNSMTLPVNSSNRCASLDRRRRKLRTNKVERDHRTKSQSDLVFCDRAIPPPHFCSIQQFQQYPSNPYMNGFCNNTEERLRKLENERSSLHMEISVLSEQLDSQSSKILDLENALQNKRDALRHLEESLQKEVLSRSNLETQKLELLSSLSEMKLRQASLEHENLALRNNTSPLSNGERFSRHAGHYSSLPRPPTLAKKGVVFGKPPCAVTNVQSSNGLAVKGVPARCLSAPLLADEEKSVISESLPYVESAPQKPLGQLSVDEVGEWLSRLGLETYTNEMKRWGANGAKLLDASHSQIDKEIDIKNPLHRKKLIYAIECERSNGAGFCGSEKMDNAAVLRWLDDMGLHQHKDAFHSAKVDGRVLHRLTTEDLLNLGVITQLHAASLRRGIQVLRELNFEYDNLERRSATGDGANSSNVAHWTNHRMMEWLRVVDLAEYAPNMRGSGVHGGLIIYEHRFTSELLAALLNMPPAKTLLRRHLTTHFNQILGREVVQQKREMESTLGFVPLSLTARLKVPKRTQFTLKRKKSKNEMDFGHLVCPLEGSPPGTPSTPGSPNLNSPIL